MISKFLRRRYPGALTVIGEKGIETKPLPVFTQLFHATKHQSQTGTLTPVPSGYSPPAG